LLNQGIHGRCDGKRDIAIRPGRSSRLPYDRGIRLLHVVHQRLGNREFTPVNFIGDLFLVLFGNLGDNLPAVL
jgi:hypothetical protein